jgi:hypothetical protein
LVYVLQHSSPEQSIRSGLIAPAMLPERYRGTSSCKSEDTIHGLVPKGGSTLYSSQGKRLALRQNA